MHTLRGKHDYFSILTMSDALFGCRGFFTVLIGHQKVLIGVGHGPNIKVYTLHSTINFTVSITGKIKIDATGVGCIAIIEDSLVVKEDRQSVGICCSHVAHRELVMLANL